jgi:hypothetical protein
MVISQTFYDLPGLAEREGSGWVFIRGLRRSSFTPGTGRTDPPTDRD